MALLAHFVFRNSCLSEWSLLSERVIVSKVPNESEKTLTTVLGDLMLGVCGRKLRAKR
jgi:hypothetical protein